MNTDTLHEITLKDKTGQVLCRVHYRMEGAPLRWRYKKFRCGFKSIVKPLATVDIRPDGSGVTAKGEKTISKAEVALKKRLNALLGVDEAERLFTWRRPFASVGGEFFCLQIIKALASEIERATGQR